MNASYARSLGMDPNAIVKIAAKSFFKELKNQGFNNNEIINLSGELIHMVSSELRRQNKQTKA